MDRLVPLVSVIIPVFNDTDRLRLCLEALSQQTYPQSSYEVIVVDNGSDKSPETLLSNFPGMEIRFLFEAKVGSYAARNLAIQHAQGDILAFTDSDCIPNRDWIQKGTEKVSATNNCGLVAGKVTIFYQNGEPSNSAELYDKVSAFPQKRYVEKGKFGVTANLFTLKRIFQEVGYFNDQLVSAGDNEWGTRVNEAGYQMAYAEEAVIKHPARNSIKSIRNKALRVAYGLYQLSLIERSDKNKVHYKFKQLYRTGRDIKTTLNLIIKILYETEIPTLKDRQTLILLAGYIRYLRIIESIRLEIGLSPQVSR